VASASGRAAIEATAQAAARFGPAAVLGGTGLSVSAIGIAASRLEPDDVLHARALRMALDAGINLVGVGPRGAGASVVGRVLAESIAAGSVSREGVVIVAEFACAPEVPSGASSIDALARSWADTVGRLGVDALDVALLRVPTLASITGMRSAMAALEARVDAGALGGWGLAVPALALGPGDSRRVELDAVLEAAAGSGRCAVVQLPVNLLELGATATAQDRPSPLAAAAAAGLGLLAERPLRPLRAAPLVEPRGESPELATPLAALRKLEARWASDLGRALRIGGGDATDLFRWGQLLSQAEARPDDLDGWQRLRHDVIAPHVGQASAALLGHLQGEERLAFGQWWREYGTALHAAFTAIERSLVRAPFGRRVAAAIDPVLPESWRSLSLAARAVAVAASSGVTAAMVGMRTPAAVADLLALRGVLPAQLDVAAVAAALEPVAAQLAQDG
jgi:aryl-alcohol dehydrogenase-like predicted oxidoreductase